MRKLKRFVVSSSRCLTADEMTALNGGEFIPYACYTYGQACVIPASGGVNTGTCKWVDTSVGQKTLTCVVNA